MTYWQLYRAWNNNTVKKSDHSPEEVKTIEGIVAICLSGDFGAAAEAIVDDNWTTAKGRPLKSKRAIYKVYNSLREFARNTGQFAVGGTYPTQAEKLAREMLASKVHISELIDSLAAILDAAAEPEVLLKSYEGINVPVVIKKLRALSVVGQDAY